MTSDGGQQGDEFSTEQLVTLFHERLDNKSRRIARAMQFNVVAATVAVSVGQLAAGTVTIPVNATITVGAALLLVSFVAGFAGLAAAGHPLVSVSLSRDGRAVDRGRLVAELRRRNQSVAVAQSASFAVGAPGVALLVLGVVRSLDVTTDRLPFWVVVSGVFAVVVLGHTVGHTLARCSALPAEPADGHDTGEG